MTPTAPDRSPRRHDRASALLHTFMAALLAAQLVLGFVFHAMARGPLRSGLFAWHKTLGVAILLLAAAWIGRRLRRPVAPRTGRAAAALRGALFALPVALPVTGLVAVSGYADTPVIALIGGVVLPEIPGVSRDAGEAFEQYHKLLVTIFVWLIALHVGVVLWRRVRR